MVAISENPRLPSPAERERQVAAMEAFCVVLTRVDAKIPTLEC